MFEYNLKDRIARYRQLLMGLAILWIFMLHSGETGNPLYDAIRFYGWAGVDVFFFLSAIGVCHSLKKNKNIISFYNRRVIRVILTWFSVLFIIHLAGLLCNYYLPDLPFYVPNTILKCLTWYLVSLFFENKYLIIACSLFICTLSAFVLRKTIERGLKVIS